MLGVVRLHESSDRKTGEYAILVRSDVKGRGLGWLLMQTIVEYARAEGLTSIEGQVLHDNVTMVSMCRQLGFSVQPDPEDADIVLVRLELGSDAVMPRG
jgi:acetyltransferase